MIPINNLIRARRPLRINAQNRSYASSGKFLGLNFTRTGFRTHFTQKAAQAQSELSKLYRFRNLDMATKRRLYVARVRSILEYPAIPMHVGAKSNIIKYQRVQNKALRFITNTYYPETPTMESLHRRCNLPPMNQVLHRRAQNVWNRIRYRGDVLFNQLGQQQAGRNKRGFASSREAALEPDPPPIYVL